MDSDIYIELEQIHMVTSCYKGKMRFDRTDIYDIGNFQEVYDPLTALIVFPLFNLSSILELAENGLRLPSSIIHFLIRERCLHLNYPLDELANNLPTSAKQELLDHWIDERIINRNIRHYSESTILFDD